MTPVAALKMRVKRSVEKRLDRAASAYLDDSALARVDFSRPAGEAALSPPTSVSWRVFKNPVTLFIGGVTAVLLEFAEPRVRSGVWDHSTFRIDPVRRMKRTGLAAMVTVYGPRSVSEQMIEAVSRRHARVAGVTPSGQPYAASDPDLLSWVQATAAYGFMESYSAYAVPLDEEARDRSYRDGRRAALLYGAARAPTSVAEQRAFFAEMRDRLEASPILFEFLDIMRHAPALPYPAQLAQGLLVRAAVDLVPREIREITGLGERYGLKPFEKLIVRRMARRADRLLLRSSPPAQACLRLGLPEDYLYDRR